MTDDYPVALNIPDVPPALKVLLDRMPDATGGFVVSQHLYDPRPNEWYAGWKSGDVGPYATAEEALYAGIRWLHRLIEEADAARRQVREAAWAGHEQ